MAPILINGKSWLGRASPLARLLLLMTAPLERRAPSEDQPAGALSMNPTTAANRPSAASAQKSTPARPWRAP
jgi:hypothetical protein